MEDADNVSHHLVNRDVRVFPSIKNTWSDVGQNGGCNFTGWLIERVGEVVFGEERVSRICTMGIGPWF